MGKIYISMAPSWAERQRMKNKTDACLPVGAKVWPVHGAAGNKKFSTNHTLTRPRYKWWAGSPQKLTRQVNIDLNQVLSITALRDAVILAGYKGAMPFERFQDDSTYGVLFFPAPIREKGVPKRARVSGFIFQHRDVVT